MTRTDSPQGKAEEKGGVPWCIQFSGKDLLAAAWGSKKGADLLYHFIHKASWEKKNKHENETLKDIKFQESTPKALEKSGLSLGCFHTYLKHFISVGYVSTEAYSGEYTVHIEVIQQAFSNTPEKPVSETGKRRQPRSESFNLKDCNFVTLPREDYEILVTMKDECFKLKEMFHSLKDSYAQTLGELKEMFHSLKQNPTIYTAQEASVEAFSDLQSNALRDSESTDKESKKDVCANAPHTRLQLLDLTSDLDTVLSEDLPSAQMSYSHNINPTSEQNKEKEVVGAGCGYKQANDTNTSSEQEKLTRGKGRGKKPKVEQPTLLDTNKKGVAYNDDEQRVFDWYSHLDFNRVAPEQTPTRKQHSATLVPHVHSQEDMQSLADFTKAGLEKRGIKVYVVEMGNMTNSKNLNEWLAQRNQVKPSAPQPDTYSSTPEVDLNKPVVWTRYKHQGAARDHWYLYAVMPLSEALQYGYKADMIPPNDRGSIKTMLKSLAEGRRELTPEQKSEVETAELRLHLVA